MYKKLAILGFLASSAFAAATTLTLNLNLNNLQSFDEFGDPDNFVTSINMATQFPGYSGFTVTGIGWDVTLFADSPSWLSELKVSFEDSAQTNGLFLTPGIGDDAPGTQAYTSGGIVDLVGLNLDFPLLADNKMRVEFFEGFDDYPDDWDGVWNGTLSVQMEAVPEPASMLAVGAGLAAVARRRRKNAA